MPTSTAPHADRPIAATAREAAAAVALLLGAEAELDEVDHDVR